MRKLASIQKIRDIQPIEGADAIEVATINSWKVVVAKNVGHKPGDKVVYFEIDSFLPIEPEFEFLRKTSYRKLETGEEGFRLKTMKLRGELSQGLIIPLKVAYEVANRKSSIPMKIETWEIAAEGTEVTTLLGVTKWDLPLPAELEGKAKGYLPSFITKTEEERIQNFTKPYELWKEKKCYFFITEKLHGESISFYINQGVYGVCTHRLELLEPKSSEVYSVFWRVGENLGIKEKLTSLGRNICIQGELIGEGIFKNKYRIKGNTVRFFNAFDIDKQERLTFHEFKTLMEKLGLEIVPVLGVGVSLPETIEEILKWAEGKSVLNPKTEREGIVIKSLDFQISFKAISNKFLLGEKE